MPAPNERISSVDALRAVAMLWMTAYHFCYDLNWFGWWRQSFLTDPFWVFQRSAIVCLFMFCAGYGQALAVRSGQPHTRFWRRWVQIAAGATLVSIASWWVFPRTWIYFGVLHAMAVLLVVLRMGGPWLMLHQAALPVLAVAAIGGAWLATAWPGTGPWAEGLNRAPVNVLGWVSRKPVTEDYVPILPWIGPMMLGFWAGCRGWLEWPAPNRSLDSGRFTTRLALARLGRFSLSYYLLHQPVLLAGLWLADRLWR